MTEETESFPLAPAGKNSSVPAKRTQVDHAIAANFFSRIGPETGRFLMNFRTIERNRAGPTSGNTRNCVSGFRPFPTSRVPPLHHRLRSPCPHFAPFAPLPESAPATYAIFILWPSTHRRNLSEKSSALKRNTEPTEPRLSRLRMTSSDPEKNISSEIESPNATFLSLLFDLDAFDPAVLRMVVAKAEVERCPPSEAIQLLLNELAAREGLESAWEERE